MEQTTITPEPQEEPTSAWVTPAFERVELEEALNSFVTLAALDGPASYS
jgi:hypothetical protein